MVSPPNEGNHYRWGSLKSAIFGQYLAMISEMVQDKDKSNSNLKALYRMVLFSATLRDRNSPNHAIFYFFASCNGWTSRLPIWYTS